MELLGGDNARTGTHHEARRRNRLRVGGGTGLANILVEQILKHRPVTLKRNGVDVGEVVTLDVYVEDGDVVSVNVMEDVPVVVEDEVTVEVPDVVGLEVAVVV